jgi:sigma-B regulation protein RsbU (phosphoserine phosphatase)
LGSGDLICFYTDGIIDAFNMKDEPFGEKRLENLLEKIHRLPATEVVRRLVSTVQDYAAGCGQHDDMTIIVLKAV